MSEYIITDKQMGLIQDFATVCVEGEKLPRIVRCRDCRYCMNYWRCDYCDYFNKVVNDPDGFCAWGERRG